MTEKERWQYLLSLDDELLLGGVTISEWGALIVREADIAFVKGAHLASIITATAAIETYLRAEGEKSRRSLQDRIDKAAWLPQDLRDDLQELRRYRNGWVHVDDPNCDEAVLERPEGFEQELEQS